MTSKLSTWRTASFIALLVVLVFGWMYLQYGLSRFVGGITNNTTITAVSKVLAFVGGLGGSFGCMWVVARRLFATPQTDMSPGLYLPTRGDLGLRFACSFTTPEIPRSEFRALGKVLDAAAEESVSLDASQPQVALRLEPLESFVDHFGLALKYAELDLVRDWTKSRLLRVLLMQIMQNAQAADLEILRAEYEPSRNALIVDFAGHGRSVVELEQVSEELENILKLASFRRKMLPGPTN